MSDSVQLLALLLAGVVAAAVCLATARWPVAGCCLLALAVPLTVGLERGAVVPLLRVNEALTLVVGLGVLMNRMLDPKEQRLTGLDLAVTAVALGLFLIPLMVRWVSGLSTDADGLRVLVAPLQYAVIYWLFSRAALTMFQVRLVVGLALVASCLMALIGVLQLADAPGVRAAIDRAYPPAAPDICDLAGCRPTSLLQHWSAFGAYALMHYALALGLLGSGGVGFPRRLLVLVAAANAVAVIASETQAVILALPIVTAIVMLHRGRIPREIVHLLAVGTVSAALLWPLIAPRLLNQLFYNGSLSTPESLLTRYRYWTELFVPNAMEHLWFGTASVIPADVPTRFARFVDNEYLGLLFRAGVLGLILFAVALATIGVVAAGTRHGAAPLAASIGAALLADVVALALMGLTAEYSTFAGVSQTLWTTAGLLALTRQPAWRTAQHAVDRLVVSQPVRVLR